MDERTRQFELATLPHLNAAYNLARWLLGDDQNAQDVVQESYLRAFKYFDGFHGGDARPWLLGIVRNACHSWFQATGRSRDFLEFDEERDSGVAEDAVNPLFANPETQLLRQLDHARVDGAIRKLPPLFREVLILRELEELPYEDIARIAGIPPGTVMSRLARARALLRAELSEPKEK